MKEKCNGLVGQINPRATRVLRDTGSMVQAMHKDLVKDHELWTL